MGGKHDDPWRMIGLVGTLGMEIFGCIIGGAFIGSYLDKEFKSDPLWLTVCILGGFALGLLSAYYTLTTFTKD